MNPAHDDLPWARWWERRCRARRERRSNFWASGRCDLVRGHPGDHALKRGLDTPRWSTDWTDTAWEATPKGVLARDLTEGGWLHHNGTPCEVFTASRPTGEAGIVWWCTEHQQHLTWQPMIDGWWLHRGDGTACEVYNESVSISLRRMTLWCPRHKQYVAWQQAERAS